jgi:hypothetical protein
MMRQGYWDAMTLMSQSRSDPNAQADNVRRSAHMPIDVAALKLQDADATVWQHD